MTYFIICLKNWACIWQVCSSLDSVIVILDKTLLQVGCLKLSLQRTQENISSAARGGILRVFKAVLLQTRLCIKIIRAPSLPQLCHIFSRRARLTRGHRLTKVYIERWLESNCCCTLDFQCHRQLWTILQQLLGLVYVNNLKGKSLPMFSTLLLLKFC